MEEPQPPVKRRRRTKQPNRKKMIPFFKRQVDHFEMSYFEVTVYVVMGTVCLLILFRNVIYQAVSGFFGY